MTAPPWRCGWPSHRVIETKERAEIGELVVMGVRGSGGVGQHPDTPRVRGSIRDGPVGCNGTVVGEQARANQAGSAGPSGIRFCSGGRGKVGPDHAAAPRADVPSAAHGIGGGLPQRP